MPVAALTLLAALLPAAAATPPLSPAEERGRAIYTTGTSPSGAPITALFGSDRLELPGEAATCGSCHGHDGEGRPESGVLPSNITWKHLMRSYGHLHPDGLEHPAFDEASLRGYLRTGIYPGGRRGDPSMPLYVLSETDLDDLVAYLERLGELLDPGLSPTAIRLGTLVPAGGERGAIGAAIRGVVEALFAELNEGGGLYGRRIELVVRELPAEPEAALAEASAWLEREEPFALVSPFTPGIDGELQAEVSRRGIPLVGPFTLYSLRRFDLNRNVFYLYPGLGEQLEALVEFVGAELGLAEPRLAALYPRDSPLAEVLETLAGAARERGWPEPVREGYTAGAFDAPAAAARLREAGIDGVVALGIEPELRSFLAAAAASGWHPYVLAPGALAGAAPLDAPPGFAGRLYLAYPTLPRDRSAWALGRLARLFPRGDGPPPHLQAVVSAYAAATVLVEGLRRAGRGLGRAELTAELEKLYRFETGLTPPITYTANRRVGASGAYVLGPAAREGGRLPESVAWVDVP